MRESTGYDFTGIGDTQTQASMHQFVDDTYVSLVKAREKALTMMIIIGNSWSYNLYLVVPFDCEIVKIYSVIQAEIATANETLTFYNDAGIALTNGAITIEYIGSAEGDVDNCTPTNNNRFEAGEEVKIHIGSENSNTVRCDLTFLCKVG